MTDVQLDRDREVANQIAELLDQLDDHGEQGFTLALVTEAWLRSFVAPDPGQQQEAWRAMLMNHTTAILQLLHKPTQ